MKPNLTEHSNDFEVVNVKKIVEMLQKDVERLDEENKRLKNVSNTNNL